MQIEESKESDDYLLKLNIYTAITGNNI